MHYKKKKYKKCKNIWWIKKKVLYLYCKNKQIKKEITGGGMVSWGIYPMNLSTE